MVVALVKSADENYVVGVLRLFHGFRYESFRRAMVSKVLARIYQIIRSGGVAHITANPFNVGLSGKCVLKTLERGDFVSGLKV